MSKSEVVLRLNEVRGQPRDVEKFSCHFGLLGGTEAGRWALKRKLHQRLEAHFAPEVAFFREHKYRPYAHAATPGGTGFILYPQTITWSRTFAATPFILPGDFFSLVQELEEILAEEEVKVDLLKMLDALARLEMYDGRHHSAACSTLDRAVSWPLIEEHGRTVRSIWERYLPYFLTEARHRRAYAAPDFVAELLLEAPLLDLILVQKMREKHLIFSRPNRLYLPVLARHLEFPEIEASLGRLVDQEFLASVGYLYDHEQRAGQFSLPVPATRRFETEVCFGPRAKELDGFSLPQL
jgi:hypothetical protein